MKYCLALDLVDDEQSIADYESWHKTVWPEIIVSIRESGIESMEIYRVFNRLFMIMETNPSFDFEKKKQLDESNAVVLQWESMMEKYQQLIPGTPPGSKWVLMNKVFDLND